MNYFHNENLFATNFMKIYILNVDMIKMCSLYVHLFVRWMYVKQYTTVKQHIILLCLQDSVFLYSNVIRTTTTTITNMK